MAVLRRNGVSLVMGFLLGICFTVAATRLPASMGQAPAPEQQAPAYRGLDAGLYMMTSAEYRACCYQTFTWAKQVLQTKLEKATRNGKPLAVVADLDETLIDNGAYQSMQIRRNIGFDKALWNVWQEKYGDEVQLIPGAGEFVKQAREAGVALVYISNRDETYREPLKKALDRLGIGIANENQLKLATDTSNKTKRRAEAEEQYQVLVYLGDNLRDFDETFRTVTLADKKIETLQAAIAQRKQMVDQHRAKFGDQWIILPNPAYGEWTVPSTKSKDDQELLTAPPKEWR